MHAKHRTVLVVAVSDREPDQRSKHLLKFGSEARRTPPSAGEIDFVGRQVLMAVAIVVCDVGIRYSDCIAHVIASTGDGGEQPELPELGFGEARANIAAARTESERLRAEVSTKHMGFLPTWYLL